VSGLIAGLSPFRLGVFGPARAPSRYVRVSAVRRQDQTTWNSHHEHTFTEQQMRIRLFPSPFWEGDAATDISALTELLERAGVPADRRSAAVAELAQDKRAEIDLPNVVDLRELAESIPSLTIEVID